MTDFKKLIGLDVEVPTIKLRELSTLVRYERNSRTHSKAQVEQLERMLLEFGWTNSVLVDEKGIVAGHGRCMAAENIYRRGEQIKFPNGSPIPIGFVPTVDCSGWSDNQRKAYIIGDNQSALTAGWDIDILTAELRELQEADFDLHLTAFSEAELDELLAPIVGDPELQGDPDYQPEAPAEPISQRGDTWILGNHRVRCGDATSLNDWDELMKGETADVCWIDPPFNVDLGRKNRLMDKAVGGKRSATGSITNDKMSDAEFSEFLQELFASLFAVMRAGAPIYVAHADKVGLVFRQKFEDAGFHFSQMLIWNKGQHVIGMADHHSSHESILYGWKVGAKHSWYGGRKNKTVFDTGEGGPIRQLEDGRWCIKIGDSSLIVSGDAQLEEAPSTVFYEPKPDKSGLHPSTKPVALIERQLSNSARAGDIVIDGCGGSGSTLIAAHRLGMSARIMELEPKFCDVIIQRWQHVTGKVAIHERTGEPYGGGALPSDPEQPDAEPDFDFDAGLDVF